VPPAALAVPEDEGFAEPLLPQAATNRLRVAIATTPAVRMRIEVLLINRGY
jgi:hypothetical protein